MAQFPAGRPNNTFKKKIFNFRSKFVLSFLLLILLPFAVFSFFTGNYLYDVWEKRVFEDITSLTDKISEDLDNYLKDADFLINLVADSPQLASYFNIVAINKNNINSYSVFESAEKQTGAHKLISSIIGLKSGILSGMYYLDNENLYFIHPYYSYAISGNIYQDEDWYRGIIKSPDNINFTIANIPLPGISSSNAFSVLKPVFGSSDGNISGVFLIALNLENFTGSYLQNITDKYPGSIFLISDSYDRIVYSSDKSFLPDKFEPSSAPVSPVQPLLIDFKGSSIYMVLRTSPEYSWKVISLIPAVHINSQLQLLKISVPVLSLICILATFFLAFKVLTGLLRPVDKLAAAMSEAEKGNLSVRVNIKSNDEMRIIADAFNNMVQKIEHLVQKVYSFQIKQKEAELDALQNQINPHFLYNTLESIRGAALYSGMETIAEMAKCLSQLFRYNISGEVIVPISREIEHLDNYLKIQNFRHDDKFEIIYDIPDRLYDYSILKLCLQPLVENSIKHGLEMKLGKGRICIKMYEYNNILKVEISDDGIGIREEQIHELNRILSEEPSFEGFSNQSTGQSARKGTGTKIGIQNVNARIKLTFGRQYGLKYKLSEVGTTVEMLLPLYKANSLRQIPAGGAGRINESNNS